jgi:DNA-binding MarR family transcriptional regulator
LTASLVSDDVGDLVALSLVLVSVASRSLAAADTPIPLPQFRPLTVLARLGPCTVGGLAEALDTHASNVTRLCDKLVASGLVTRENRPENRREVEIALTERGQALVQDVLTARAVELEAILARLPRASRKALGRLLPELLAAAGSAAPLPGEGWAV